MDIRSSLRQAEEEQKRAEEEAAEESALDLIDGLGLSARTLNTLKNVGVARTAEVVAMAKPDLMRINGFGEKSYEELHQRLVALGFVEAPVEEPPEVEEPAIVEEVEEEAPPAPVVDEVQEPEAASVEAEAVEEAPEAEEPESVPQAPETVAEQAEEEEEAVPEPEPAAPEPEPVVEAVAQEETVEAPAVEAEPEPEPAAPVPMEVETPVAAELAPEAVFAAEVVPVGGPPREEEADGSSSIHDLPEDIWSIRRASRSGQPGQIRFAEDIEGLRGGVTSRRERRGESRGGRRRGGRAGRRRVRR